MRPVSKDLRTLKWITYLLLLIAGCPPFFYFFWPESLAFFPPHDILARYGGVSQLEIWQQLLGFFVTALPAGALFWALILVLQLINLLQMGKWFEEASEKLCRTFSKVMLWFVLLQFLHRTLLVFVITATNPPGKKELFISLSTDDIFALVPVVFALVFAHIIKLAREQRDELNQIV